MKLRQAAATLMGGIVLTAGLSAAASAAPFVSPHGYTLSVPTAWHLKSPPIGADDADIVVNQSVAAGHQMTTPMFQVQYRAVDAPITSANLAEMNRGVLDVVRRSSTQFKVVSQTPSTLSGTPSLDCVFAATMNGLPLRFHEVLVIKNKAAYTFTAICPSQVYSRYAPAYAQMLSSVRWKQ